MPPGFSLQGHRGARGLFPENTLAGFVATIALGVDAIELDVAVTADDVPVVTHDPRLNPDLTRLSDGSWLDGPPPPIRALTAGQLAEYDVGRIRPGTACAAAFPDQQPQDGARIPRLSEVFALPPPVAFTVELKTFPDHPDLTVHPAIMADLVVAAARTAGVLPRLVVQSFDWRGLRHLQRCHPTIALAWLTECRPNALGRAAPAAIAAEGGRIWCPQLDELDPAAMAEARRLGLRVIPWDANDGPAIRHALGLRVDGIITDRPDLARRAGADGTGQDGLRSHPATSHRCG